MGRSSKYLIPSKMVSFRLSEDDLMRLDSLVDEERGRATEGMFLLEINRTAMVKALIRVAYTLAEENARKLSESVERTKKRNKRKTGKTVMPESA